MNKINAIYTTVSDGQTHIALDTKYIGSVDSYNNCFTQFLAWLPGNSVAVNFDGKIRSLNKESYKNLLYHLTQRNKISNIEKFTLFRKVAENTKLPESHLKMRDVISVSDKNALFKKLADAISKVDTARALLMIGKGAEVEKNYRDRGEYGPIFNDESDSADLDKSSCSFSVFKGSPIMQAANKANVAVVEFLRETGANIDVIGEKYTFTREAKVQKYHEWVSEPVNVPHLEYNQYGFLVNRERIQYIPRMVEKESVTNYDHRSNSVNYKFNSDLKLVSC